MENKFYLFMQNRNLSQNTCNSYLSDIDIFKQYYFNSYGEELKIILHSDIIMYRTYLFNNNAPVSTINRKLAAIRMYNQFLIKSEIQQDIAICNKDYVKIQPTIVNKQLPSIKEINKLKHFACKDTKNAKRDNCLISLFVYGGIRESELVSIRITDIHLEERFINIFGKCNKFRQIIINDYLYDALYEYLEERRKLNISSNYLFVGQKTPSNGGKPLNRNFCNRILDKYKKLCNIEVLHPHILRAFFCSNALHNAGYSIDQVANQVGHSSLNTTKKYLSTKREDLISLANKL